jgi:hypothetical protein
VLVGGEIVTLFAAFPAIGQIFRRHRRMLVLLAGLFVITLLGIVPGGRSGLAAGHVSRCGRVVADIRVKPFFGSV